MMLERNSEKRRLHMTGLVLAAALATAAGPASGQSGGGGAGGSAGGGASAAGSGGTSSSPGTNSAGTAQSSGGAAPRGSITVGRPGNPAGGANVGRIDGTTTPGPSLEGDERIRSETSRDSDVGRKIKSICRGC